MAIIDVGDKDTSVRLYLYGNIKKEKRLLPKHRDKRKIIDCYTKGMGGL